MANRKGEKDATHFRSDRIENINGQWFFRVREPFELMGPFSTHEYVCKAAKAYLDDRNFGRSGTSALSNQYLNKAFSLK